MAQFALLAMLSACAAATERLDHYADRVTTYNKEAELAQDRSILLNVLRASKRRPLSFFELQSVSAQGTPSGQIGFSIPLTQNGNTGSPSPTSTAPQFSLSGGPTISANYIDTQEFYQGILKPIPMDTIDFFIQRGISDNLLFNLFFSRAIVRVHDDGAAKGAAAQKTKPDDHWDLKVANFAGDDVSLDRYQMLVESLLNAGLSTESKDADPTDFGPVLTEKEAAESGFLGKAATGTLALKAMDWCDLDYADRQGLAGRGSFALPTYEAQKKACDDLAAAGTDLESAKARADVAALLGGNVSTTFYRLQKPAGDSSHVFCFSRSSHKLGLAARVEIDKGLCDDDDPKSALTANAVPGAALKAFFDGAGITPAPCVGSDNRDCVASLSYDVKFVQRSTYGVIYYLGEIVRRELYPEQHPDHPTSRRQVMVRLGPGDYQIPHLRCGGEARTSTEPTAGADFTFAEPLRTGPGQYHCAKVFDLEAAAAASRRFLAVTYDGQTFSVPDGSEAAETNEVLDIVSELVALTRSAKDAPTSSLVTLVGSH